MTKITYHLFDDATAGPEELDISADMSNEKAIARWWDDVKLYVKAMDALDRSVLIVFDDDGGYYRLSSHPNEMDGKLVNGVAVPHSELGKDTPASKPRISNEVLAEVARAVKKFPTWPTDPFHAITVVGEEVGEVNKALVQIVYESEKGVTRSDLRAEAIQLAAMAFRFIASLDDYDYKPGKQHKQEIITNV